MQPHGSYFLLVFILVDLQEWNISVESESGTGVSNDMHGDVWPQLANNKLFGSAHPENAPHFADFPLISTFKIKETQRTQPN